MDVKGGMKMNHAKIIKVISVLALIIGIIGLIVSLILMLTGGLVASVSGNPEITSEMANDPALTSALNELNTATGSDLPMEAAPAAVGVLIIIAAVMMLISSIFAILEGVFGFRAAKGKGATAALFIGIIALATAIVRLIMAIVSGGGGSGILGAIPAIIIAGIYVYCAKAIRDNKGKMI